MIFNLPNELIEKILKLCDGVDVLNFEEASNFDVSYIITDEHFWKKVTLRPPSMYARCQKFMGVHTHCLEVVGASRGKLSQLRLSRMFLRCPHLTNVKIENVCLPSSSILHAVFPKSVRNLKLSKISLSNKKSERYNPCDSPFSNIKIHLPLLEKLNLISPDYLTATDGIGIYTSAHWDSGYIPSLEIYNGNFHFIFEKETVPENMHEKIKLKLKWQQGCHKIFHMLMEYFDVSPSLYCNPYARRGIPEYTSVLRNDCLIA